MAKATKIRLPAIQPGENPEEWILRLEQMLENHGLGYLIAPKSKTTGALIRYYKGLQDSPDPIEPHAS